MPYFSVPHHVRSVFGPHGSAVLIDQQFHAAYAGIFLDHYGVIVVRKFHHLIDFQIGYRQPVNVPFDCLPCLVQRSDAARFISIGLGIAYRHAALGVVGPPNCPPLPARCTQSGRKPRRRFPHPIPPRPGPPLSHGTSAKEPARSPNIIGIQPLELRPATAVEAHSCVSPKPSAIPPAIRSSPQSHRSKNQHKRPHVFSLSVHSSYIANLHV